VNTHTPGDQSAPQVAALSSSSFVVCWQSSDQDGSSYGIVAQRAGIVGTNSYPNLVVPAVAGPSEVVLGETVEVALMIRNTGPLAPASTAHLWLSDDNVFSSATIWTRAWTYFVPGLFCNAWDSTYVTTVSYTWPGEDPLARIVSTYFVVGGCDGGDPGIYEDDNGGVSPAAWLACDLVGAI
jgi:hypothetical protein